MNLEKNIIDVISSVTGIPVTEISQEKFLEKDLGVSGLELEDILTEAGNKLHLKLPMEHKELKTVQDVILFVHENQPIS